MGGVSGNSKIILTAKTVKKSTIPAVPRIFLVFSDSLVWASQGIAGIRKKRGWYRKATKGLPENKLQKARVSPQAGQGRPII
jgi:hypothetical protein